MSAGVLVPVPASPYSLGINPREPVPNQLVFEHTGTEPEDWSAKAVSSVMKLIQCILLAPKLLGFLREMWRYDRYHPNLRARFCTPPEAKGTMKIQAWG